MDAVTSHNSETTESTPMNLCLSLKWNASVSLPELRLVFLNALIAFKTQGALTFRLEDLNSEPASNEQIQKLKTELAAFNQDQHSFYLQSKHKSDYSQSLDQLIQAKKAYPCYCSPEALDEERRRLLTQGKMYRYNGVCRELTSEKIKEHESRGVSPIIRLRVDRQILKIQDQVLGELIYDTDPIGDFILQGATGKLTADFLTVVDYLNLQITQVVCGEDEKEALARQHLIYQAFNQPPPQAAHIPLLLSAEKKLLSSKKDAIPFELLQQE